MTQKSVDYTQTDSTLAPKHSLSICLSLPCRFIEKRGLKVAPHLPPRKAISALTPLISPFPPCKDFFYRELRDRRRNKAEKVLFAAIFKSFKARPQTHTNGCTTSVHGPVRGGLQWRQTDSGGTGQFLVAASSIYTHTHTHKIIYEHVGWSRAGWHSSPY